MQNKKLLIIFINLILIVLGAGIIAIAYQSLPPQVPLLYSLPWGEGQLANKIFLFLLPVISLLFLLVNIFILKLFKLKEDEENAKKTEFIKESLLFTSLTVSIINLITVVKIVRLFI